MLLLAGMLGFPMGVSSDFEYIEGVVRELVFSEWTEVSVVYKLNKIGLNKRAFKKETD